MCSASLAELSIFNYADPLISNIHRSQASTVACRAPHKIADFTTSLCRALLLIPLLFSFTATFLVDIKRCINTCYLILPRKLMKRYLLLSSEVPVTCFTLHVRTILINYPSTSWTTSSGHTYFSSDAYLDIAKMHRESLEVSAQLLFSVSYFVLG